MIGLIFHSAVSPDEIQSRLNGDEILEVFYGRPLARKTVQEIWRVWPELSAIKRDRLRELLWQAGETPRLLIAATGTRDGRRARALERLFTLGDPRTLAPLLAAWGRFGETDQRRILQFAGRTGHPDLAELIWQELAVRTGDPVPAMARLVREVGSELLEAVGELLADELPPLWAWETLVRLGGKQTQSYLVACLGRHDELAGRAKLHFSSLPAEEALPPLMKAARSHHSWEVRIGAVTALLRRKEPQALRFLTDLLRDQSWYQDPVWDSVAGTRHPWAMLTGDGEGVAVRH